ncbi:TDP-4-keto-6-deoxy-D-glucose transaminase [Paludibacter propionicigenes WB4]|uniref:TDP-4-keto-6-deoxy-D-glucose transaminase n=1 Tax=Paludibacter propionicigenes (strain DSM 17365 / JCM 13257 / WB4) TaxID=694427 RepID=E4T3K1_PALPW|nr:dTDP-4-amino-4,6-dideoxygalactose transaminase [Paludibacter propionicigenes]ADQ79295.1 TDP-4-keto-6-deoxy-D-glucose transaminase [Paludibacter propionicigenes WB4]
MIPFNKPYLTGKEAHYMYEAVFTGKLSGNGMFTQRCQAYFEKRYGFQKCLLTTSCTDALEMAAILCDVKPGDEVIIPSYTFVSTALAFVRQGATIVFADSQSEHPNIDADKIEALITPRTKVIVPVHYAGMACDMTKIMALADKYNLLVVEDAAQAVDSFYSEVSGKRQEVRALGSVGHLAAFSFHETKNIISGEGGMLAINDERFIHRAEIIWEKGTNRAEFFRGEVNKYGWVDIGSSFLPSEVIAAFLWAQIEHLDEIQNKRKEHWNRYSEALKPLADKGYFKLPQIPDYATNNAHMFYLVCPSLEERTELINALKQNEILAVFHYLSLHSSPYYAEKHDGRVLANCDRFADCLVRLPLFYELSLEDQNKIIATIKSVYSK